MSLTAQDVATFYPLDEISTGLRHHLAQESPVRAVPRGESLFTVGESDDESYFLLEGKLRGEYDNGRVKTIAAGTAGARYAVGDLQPRRFTAVAATHSVRALQVDRRFLEKLLTWDQTARSISSPLSDLNDVEDSRWVYRFLHTNAMKKLPAGNIQRLLGKLEPVAVAKGDVIIREGDAGDYFYVLRSGKCEVSKADDDNRNVVVATLDRGDSFGEDALISNQLRNATVTMLSDGKLLRLAKSDFGELLKYPVVNWVSPGQASALVRRGANLIDVRLPEEFEERAIKNAVNIPLYQLRERVAELDADADVVAYCSTGERSASAAFVLSKLGFETYAINGGLNNVLKNLPAKG